MKQIFTILVALLATTNLWAGWVDFFVDGISYYILSDEEPYTVAVTHEYIFEGHYTNYEGVTTISIPSHVTDNGITYTVVGIDDRAFESCTSLTSITIPESVTSIGGGAFEGCSSLTSITIPESVTSIGDGVFSGCTSLTSITIPNSVTSIGSQAFYECDDLTFVTIGNRVTSIGSQAFYYCRSLTSITIPESVTSIGDEAFYNCRSLTSITIPNSVTSIGSWAFWGCSALTSVTIPNSVTSIRARTFQYCRSLTSITIPNSVTSIGSMAFDGCSSLTSITIPNSVTSIGWKAFEGCSSFTSITIPESVTSIGDEAFLECRSLTSIICLGTTPPDASDLGANTSTCKLIVPHSAYNAYLRHTYWGQFLNIISGYAVTLHPNNEQWGEVTGDGLYTNDTTITITATPYEGYTFLRWSDGNTDNPRTIQVTSDTTFTADFAIEGGCLITFVDWDGTVLSSVSVAPGEAATAPADPIREGYTFIGWDKDFSAVTDHMTVTAQYQINRYRVRFFDDDNTLLKTDSVEYQSAAVAPANPYHEGYTFTGWDQTFDSITADLDIYAQYEMGENRELTVIYTNSEDNDSEIYSQSLTLTIPAAPEIEGFTFLGWKATDEFISDVITIQAIYEADTPTSTEVYINPANPAQKLIRNGQVYILKDDKTYTIMGAQIQ